MEDAGLKAWEADNAFYVAHGQESQPLTLSPRMVDILEDGYSRTCGEVSNFTRTTAKASEQRFIKALDDAHFKVVTGAQSYTSVVQEAVDELATKQTTVLYPTGHKDTIETAVLRAVRTGVNQVCSNMTLQDMKEHAWDLIRVSAHRGARYGDGGQNPGNHFWWQGKLYSLDGKTPGYPLFAETTGYGTKERGGEGLCGWNCRHSFGPGDPDHNPFPDIDEEENKAVYDLTQKQRSMESRIRREKVKLAGYKEAAESVEDETLHSHFTEKASQTAQRLRKQTAVYYSFCEENDLKPLSDRLYTAKRDRTEALKQEAERKASALTNSYKDSTIQTRGSDMSLEYQRYGRDKSTLVNSTYINSGEYRNKFDKITDNKTVNRVLYSKAKEMLEHRSGTKIEDMYWIDSKTGEVVAKIDNLPENITEQVIYPESVKKAIRGRTDLIAMHTHTRLVYRQVQQISIRPIRMSISFHL